MRDLVIAEFPVGSSPFFERLLIWAIATTIAALVGPFATYISFTFAERLTYWGVLIGGAIVMAVFIRRGMLRLLGGDDLTVDLAGAMVQAVCLGVMIWAVNLHVYGFDVMGTAWLVYHIAIVFIVCMCVVVVREQRRRWQAAGNRARAHAGEPGLDEPLSDAQEQPRPAFLERLEEPLPGPVIRVSADDHYLQVFTPDGSGRVLMRFRDALADLEEMPGYRIHRSHWVAENVLVRVRPDGRRHVAELECGAVLPVSQAHLDPLREAGFLD